MSRHEVVKGIRYQLYDSEYTTFMTPDKAAAAITDSNAARLAKPQHSRTIQDIDLYWKHYYRIYRRSHSRVLVACQNMLNMK